MKKELNVLFDISEYEKLDDLYGFIPVHKYGSHDLINDPKEWGKLILNNENLTIRFFGIDNGTE